MLEFGFHLVKESLSHTVRFSPAKIIGNYFAFLDSRISRSLKLLSTFFIWWS